MLLTRTEILYGKALHNITLMLSNSNVWYAIAGMTYANACK